MKRDSEKRDSEERKRGMECVCDREKERSRQGE